MKNLRTARTLLGQLTPNEEVAAASFELLELEQAKRPCPLDTHRVTGTISRLHREQEARRMRRNTKAKAHQRVFTEIMAEADALAYTVETLHPNHPLTPDAMEHLARVRRACGRGNQFSAVMRLADLEDTVEYIQTGA